MTQIPAPLPEINNITRPFWEAARAQRLLIQHCPDCARWQHVPILLCPACGATLGWQEPSGLATLHTFTIFHRVYHPAFAEKVPYNVSVVELDEGPQMVTNIVGCTNDALQIGMRLKVVFDQVSDDVTLPKFTPI